MVGDDETVDYLAFSGFTRLHSNSNVHGDLIEHIWIYRHARPNSVGGTRCGDVE